MYSSRCCSFSQWRWQRHAIYLSRAGGLKGVVEARLSGSLGGAPVTVGDVGFELRMPSMHLTLLAYDVALDPLMTAASSCLKRVRFSSLALSFASHAF